MKEYMDTQDIFVDEVRENINMGSYSVGFVQTVVEEKINQLWSCRNNDIPNVRFVLCGLIRGLRDLKKA